MILAIITAWLAYKRAKENGRSGPLWALIGAAVFIGTQLLVSVAIGFGLGIAVEIFGWPETLYDDYTVPITIIAVVASFGASWLLLKYLDRRPTDDSYTAPPPPPTFENEG